MKWLRITHLSIGSLAFAIVAGLLVYYLLRPRNKSKATLLLAGYVGSSTIMALSYVYCYSVLSPLAAEYYSFAQMIMFGVALLPFFGYQFPRNLHPLESKLVPFGYLALSIAAYIADFFNSRKTFSFDPLTQRFKYTSSLPFTLILALGFILTIVILLRKTVMLSAYSGRFAAWAGKPPRLASRAGLRYIVSHVLVPTVKIIKPIGREAQSARAFALITAASFGISLSYVLQFLKIITPITFAEVFNLGGLLAVLAYFVTYLNVSPEFSSFRQKLVGLSVGTVMVILGLVGAVLFSYLDKSYDRELSDRGRNTVLSLAGGDSPAIPPSISYVVARPAAGQPAAYDLLYTATPGLTPGDFERSDRAIMESERLRGNLKTPSQLRQFRFFTIRDPSSFYLHYDFTIADTLYEVGYSYQQYRDMAHELGARLATILLLSAGLILLLYPRFFRRSITMPLDELRRGVREVEGGNLDMRVPVFAVDEIGYLANAFNRMVGSIKAMSMENAQNLLRIQDMNRNLEQRVEERTRELHRKNGQVMESIQYALTIQLSILPREERMAEVCPRHFVIWKPRDVVGGDFHYFNRYGQNYLLGVVDCTGHGVPGAFMTMMVKSVLDRITGSICHDDPAKILKELNAIIRATLNQNETSGLSDDGLDIGLCYVSRTPKVVVYAGARIRLYYCVGGEVFEVTGDRQSIGYKESAEGYEYRNHEIRAHEDTVFYLMTDGYSHQSGGERGFSFGRRRLKQLWAQEYARPMEEQKEHLERVLGEYQREEAQRDDITMVGFAV